MAYLTRVSMLVAAVAVALVLLHHPVPIDPDTAPTVRARLLWGGYPSGPRTTEHLPRKTIAFDSHSHRGPFGLFSRICPLPRVSLFGSNYAPYHVSFRDHSLICLLAPFCASWQLSSYSPVSRPPCPTTSVVSSALASAARGPSLRHRPPVCPHCRWVAAGSTCLAHGPLLRGPRHHPQAPQRQWGAPCRLSAPPLLPLPPPCSPLLLAPPCPRAIVRTGGMKLLSPH